MNLIEQHKILTENIILAQTLGVDGCDGYLESVLEIAEYFGARYIAFNRSSLFTFENNVFDNKDGFHCWPLAWHLGRIFDIHDGCGNSGQCQVAWKVKVTESFFGLYHVPSKTRIGALKGYDAIFPNIFWIASDGKKISKKFDWSPYVDIEKEVEPI